MRIDLNAPPYDTTTVNDQFDGGGCTAVGGHFGTHPLTLGDCIVVGDTAYRIDGSQVECSGGSVYSSGDTGGTVVHTKSYPPKPITLKIYGEEIPLEECP